MTAVAFTTGSAQDSRPGSAGNSRPQTAPDDYRLYVRPLIDGIEWLENVGAYVDVSVR